MNTRDRARELVLAHGWNSTAYQILNPGIDHWFSQRVPAVVGYVARGKTLVVAGAPVCAPEHLGIVAGEFERQATTQDRRTCYFAAANRLSEHLPPTRHARVVLGAQPIWNPQDWPAIVRARASVRAQLARARHKGVHIVPQPAAAARLDARLRHCLRDWLAARPMPPMHFLVEPDAFDGEMTDRLTLIALRGESPVAYLLASPVPCRGGYLVEQIIRAPAAPNGTAELLIDALMTHVAGAGGTYVTLGMVPLSQHAEPWARENPFWLRALMAWARAHGRRFYHFDGLEAFRVKLCPDSWEPIYAISNEAHFSPATLRAILAAFADGPLAAVAFRTLARAGAEELRRLGAWIARGERVAQSLTC